MKESFAIKEVINNKPGYYPGYGSRQEAENNLESYRIEGGVYSVVYVKEYFNRAKDEEGNYTRSTIAEIKEPGL